jgi:hypothetical protein
MFQRVNQASRGRIDFASEQVDAESVPDNLPGFRTIFNSFHHFDPFRARAILRDAVEHREGVGVFEVPRRSFATACATVLMGLGTFFAMPFTCPFQWQLFVCTYLIPIIPAVMWIDGLLSCMRSYTPEELSQLCSAAPLKSYRWSIGTVRQSRSPITVTYLIGYPQRV